MATPGTPSTEKHTSSLQYQTLSATYHSPSNPSFTHAHQISTPPTDKVGDKTAYLNSLRKATSRLQEQINKELTSRMEEDKAREAGAGASKTNGALDEAKEEDNYGEEVVQED